MAQEWGYSIDNGPHKWVEKYPHAAGQRQSPVDIVTSRTQSVDGTGPPLSWKYSPPHTRSLTNTGFGWKVDENNKGSELSGGPLGNDVYKMEQFHAHWGDVDGSGSEHTVDGDSYSGELHLVHWNTSKYGDINEAAHKPDGLGVLGIFLTVGKHHPELDKVVKLLQYICHKGDKVTMTENMDPAKLLPEKKAYWTYPGSLTTPPCLESVTWIVFKQPIEVSPQQLSMMRGLLCYGSSEDCPMDELKGQVVKNYRPPLPLGNRELREFGGH